MTLPKPVHYLLRLGVTLGAAYLAFSQVEVGKVMPLLTAIPLPLLVAALALTHAGQFFSALRTRYYLHCQGIDFPVGPSIRLHYIGGLFNAFLPGGAGGDVYKAWWLQRHKQGRLLNMVKLMIAGRLNGLWALGVLICLMALLSAPVRQLIPYSSLGIVALAIAGTLGYSLIASLLLHEPRSQQMRAAPYSLALQLCLIGVALALATGLGQQAHLLEYVLLFMLSCMLAMLPISIGGIGVRELALLHGSRLLHLSEETGVTLAFTFTILSLTIPLIGAVIHHFYAPQGDQPKEAGMTAHRPYLLPFFCLALLVVHWANQWVATYGLTFDEAQYWFWAKHPAWGYFSKPPMIGWLIAGSTAIFGDGSFGIRMLSPMLLLLTGWVLHATARRLDYSPPTAAWVLITYVTLPMVTGNAMFFTTDVPLQLCWAIALYGVVMAVRADKQPYWLLAGRRLELA